MRCVVLGITGIWPILHLASRWAGHLETERMWMALGEGGQRLFVLPGLKLVVAITAGNYLAQDQWIPPTRVLREVILENIAGLSACPKQTPMVPSWHQAAQNRGPV
jgi:hypothetical protein